MHITMEIMGLALSIGATIGGALMALGRMWIRAEFVDHEKRMLALINGKYITREIADERYGRLADRMARIEER